MPIFQDPDLRVEPDGSPALNAGDEDTVMRRPSDDSIRTELCEGMLPDTKMEGTRPVDNNLNATLGQKLETSDRVELIESIKRGESPTWVPNRAVSKAFIASEVHVDADFNTNTSSICWHQALIQF